MANPSVVNIDNHYKGDTYDGIQYTLLNASDSSPIDLTSATIKAQFRFSSITGSIIKEITEISGITVTDAANGVFAFIIDWAFGIYYYDIEVTFVSGVVKTFVQGRIKITQDVTNG